MVGGEFASTVGDEGCDDVVDTSVQDMGAVGMDKVRVLVEPSSHVGLLSFAESESISSFHTGDSIGWLAVPHF